MTAAHDAENHGDDLILMWLDLIFTMRTIGIKASIPTMSHSQNSAAAAEAPGLNISSGGLSLR